MLQAKTVFSLREAQGRHKQPINLITLLPAPLFMPRSTAQALTMPAVIQMILGGCYFVALPIEASPLFAKIEDNEGLLYWSTYAEVDNEGFEIQKSFDAVHWESIGWVNGAGNYQGTISYEFLDRSLQYRQQYYRTVQMDYDGQSTISNIVHLHPSQSKPKRNHIAIYPNPIQVGNTLKVRAWLQDELQGSIKLYSIMGQLLFVQAFSFDTFNQLIELPIDNLSAGHYLLIIEDNQGQSLNQQKIVVTP